MINQCHMGFALIGIIDNLFAHWCNTLSMVLVMGNQIDNQVYKLLHQTEPTYKQTNRFISTVNIYLLYVTRWSLSSRSQSWVTIFLSIILFEPFDLFVKAHLVVVCQYLYFGRSVKWLDESIVHRYGIHSFCLEEVKRWFPQLLVQ